MADEQQEAWKQWLATQERVDGLRFSWNIWPHSRLDATRLVVPLVAFYSPLKQRGADDPSPPQLNYGPVVCSKQQCRAILNPYCPVDFRTKVWTCLFCHQRNPFPPNYSMIAEDRRPPELLPQFATIEYNLPKSGGVAPFFLFVVDTCVDADELAALKAALRTSLSLLPVDAIVGLVTFGRHVHVHELNARRIQRCYVFKGTKEVTQKQLTDVLAMNIGGGAPPPPAQQPGAGGPAGAAAGAARGNKFVQAISDCDMSINDLIEQLQPDSFPVALGRRPLRAVGAALSVAVTLMEVSFANTGGRIMLFVGGACTHGPGQVIDDELKHTIRSWHDLKEDDAKHFKKASKLYDSLAQRAVRNGHVIDIYSCALDQTGLYEMNSLYSLTGGHVLMGDSFKSSLFQQTFQRAFEKDANDQLLMGFNATLEVKCQKEIKIEGVIGSCANGRVKNHCVSDTEMGLGGTCQWKLCGVTPRTTVAVLLEVCGQAGPPQPGAMGFVQFVCSYQHASGQRRIRTTTACRNWADMASQQAQIAFGFDQEAAATAMARLACWRAMTDPDTTDALRWLDKCLIKVCQKFGTYHKDDPNSFVLSDNFNLFPQLLFHMRRSQLLQVFNNSPDETSYYRHILFCECVQESTTMIQPILFCYSFNGPPQPVMLDASSLMADRILLMDDFFHVLIYYGQTIAQWKKMGYDKDEQYATFKQLLEAPDSDAEMIVRERFPVPRYIVTEHDGSQARFLLSKVNPSVTHNNPYAAEGGSAVFTDDVSFDVFMQHLKKLSVASSS